MRLDATEAVREDKGSERYEQLTKLYHEIAVVLRKNIVQGTRVGESDGKDVYSRYSLELPVFKAHHDATAAGVNIRKETELGDNDTIKNAPAVDTSSRSARKR